MSTIAAPVRFCKRRRTSRISRWTVTSRAVARLVGDDQLGVAGERHRDGDTLDLAAGELVGIRADTLARIGDLDEIQQLDDPATTVRSARSRPVPAEHLIDLVADRERGIQSLRGVLEDERDP